MKEIFDSKLLNQNLAYMFDTEIIPKIINQGNNIIYFRNKFFPDGSEKRYGTDYQIFGSTLGIVPIDCYFRIIGFGIDFINSSLDDISQICNSSYFVMIVDGQRLAFEAPLRWFSRIVDKPIFDVCKVDLPSQTAFNVELRFIKNENLSKDINFGLIMKYDCYIPTR
jgi:hypothetical protein